MGVIFLFAGLALLGFGLGYLFHPGRILTLNRWVRENLFSDEWVTLIPRQVGLTLTVLSFFFLLAAVHLLSVKSDPPPSAVLCDKAVKKHPPKKAHR